MLGSHSRSFVRQCARALILFAAVGRIGAAQVTDTTSPRRVSLFTKDDAYLGAFFIAGTFALAPFDKTVAGALQKPGSQANRLFQNLATGVRLIADPGSIIIGTSMYAVGRLTDHDRLADLGLHGT